MTLTDERLQVALMPRPVRFFPQVGSTNDEAANWLQDGAAHGSVVVADEQTAGRGRMKRTWHTPPGVALAVSVILKVDPAHITQVNMAGTLAVCQMLDIAKVLGVTAKWPNDVLVNDKKISGSLPEVIWEGNALQGVILGIGVNVRTPFTEELAQHATSIEAEIGVEQDRTALLAVLLFHLDLQVERLGTPALREDYKARLTMLGQPVSVLVDGKPMHGTATDIDDQGALVVTSAAGEAVHVFASDATVLSQGA
jgi:BirA family transcriptional regulator, biotin operon repressor / biotin---[acetyl-CoA-carboxylase] ligase